MVPPSGMRYSTPMNPSIGHAINAQLRNSVLGRTSGIMVMGSWGYNRPILYPNGLQFRVSGRKFTGVVRVELNASDYYDIQFFVKNKGSWTYKTMSKDVGGENLLETLDRLIES